METLTDFVFAARNRAYGAFELRQTYALTLRRAAVVGVALCSTGLIAPLVLSRFSPREKSILFRPENVVLPPPPTENTKPVTPPPPPIETPKAPATQFKVPEIKMDELVVEETPVATQEQLHVAQAGLETVTGNPEIVEIPAEPVAKATLEVVEVKPNVEEPFLVVEQKPEFPGGDRALAEFLGNQLRYPGEASRSGVQGKVVLGFVVRADGSIADVQVLKGIGFGCDEEALRVVRLMPRWKAGRQSGRAVSARFTLPIGFVLE